MARTDDRRGENERKDVLCHDILEQILIHLPVKSLLRFKSVSKQLRDLIRDCKFVQLHTHYANQNGNVSRINMSGSTRFSRVGPSEPYSYYCQYTYDSIYYSAESPWTIGLSSICARASEIQTHEMHNPFNVRVNKIEVLGSCNGLLFTRIVNEIFLWNPSIRELVKLPSQKGFWGNFSGFYDCRFHIIAGLGYNTLTDEYKAVAYFDFCRELHIYSSRVGYWKKFPVHEIPASALHDSHWPGIVVNGCPHWVVENYMEAQYVSNRSDKIIILFDVVDEKFKRVRTPMGWNDFYECGVLASRLCVTQANPGDGTTDVWVMKEFGTVDSWTKVFNIALKSLPYRFCRPLGFAENGDEIVFEARSRRIASYNIKTGKEKVVMRSTCYFDPGFNSFQYVNSLVSPYSFCLATEKAEQGDENMWERLKLCRVQLSGF